MRGLSVLGAAIVALSTVAGVTTANAAPSVKWKGSPETSEEDKSFHVNGRFMYDVAYTDADCANAACTATNYSGIRSYSRRSFLGVDGKLSQNWRYNAKFDFSFSSSTIAPDDFYLEYAGDMGSIYIGNSNAISPMEDRTSSLNIPFNERSFLITAGGFGKLPGVAYLTNGGNWSWGIGLQSAEKLTSGDTAGSGSESGFVISRLTFAPFYQKTPEGNRFVTLGVTGRYRDKGSTPQGNFSYSPSGLSTKQSNNASVGGFGQDSYIGGEASAQFNAVGIAGEYGHFDTSRGVSASADGYYVDLFWSPTGEGRNYKVSDGSFGDIAPMRPMGAGGIGHVMLAARYENLDLTDASFTGARNETSAYTLGATWVPISHVKFQLNYSSTKVDYVVNPANVDNDIDAVTLRTQFDW